MMKMHNAVARYRNPGAAPAIGLTAFLARLVAAAPGACLVIDPATDRVLAAAEAAAALFGVGGLDGARFSALHPGCLPALIVFAEEIATFGHGWTRALKGRRADGAMLDLEYEGRALETQDGLLLVLAACDLTARARRDADAEADAYARDGLVAWSRAERMFRETERVSALILEAAGEGVYGVDTEGLTTFVNPAAERMLGWSAADLIGREIHALIHHTHADGRPYPGHECPIYNAFRHARVNRVESEVFWRKNGQPIRVEYTSVARHRR